jgi:hypothetical protein
MGFLDMYPEQVERSLKPQPNEGSHLPGFYEMHGSQIVTGAETGAILLLIAVIVMTRRHLRMAAVVILAGVIEIGGKIGDGVRLFWDEAKAMAKK